MGRVSTEGTRVPSCPAGSQHFSREDEPFAGAQDPPWWRFRPLSTEAGGFWKTLWRCGIWTEFRREDTFFCQAMVERVEESDFPAVGNITRKGMETGNCKNVPSKCISVAGEEVAWGDAIGVRPELWLAGWLRGTLHSLQRVHLGTSWRLLKKTLCVYF